MRSLMPSCSSFGDRNAIGLLFQFIPSLNYGRRSLLEVVALVRPDAHTNHTSNWNNFSGTPQSKQVAE